MAEAAAAAIADFLFVDVGVGIVEASAIASFTVSTVATVATNLAISAVVGALTRPEFPDLSREAQARKQTVRNPVEPRRIAWGETRLSGPMVYARTTGGAQDYLHMVIPLHHGEVDSIGDVYIGDKLASDARYLSQPTVVQRTVLTLQGSYAGGETVSVTINGHVYGVSGAGSIEATCSALVAAIQASPPTASGANVAARIWVAGTDNFTIQGDTYGPVAIEQSAGPSMSWTVESNAAEVAPSSLLRIKTYLGTVDQAADADLIAESGGEWTAAHRLRGIAYLYGRMLFDISAFPRGIEGMSAIVRARKPYDPRTGESVWSDNFALCVLDYLIGTVELSDGRTEPIGVGADLDEIDLDNFRAQANLCDERVTTADGGTVRRYTCNGSIQMSGNPADVIEQMLPGGAATLVHTGGKYRLHVGAYTEPGVTIDESWLRGTVNLTAFGARKELYNAVRGIYVDRTLGYEPVDFPAQAVADYADDDREVIYRDLRLNFTQDAATAQRLARLFVETARRAAQITLPCNYKAMQVAEWDTVRLNLASLPHYAGTTWRAISWRFSDSGGVDLVLRIEEASAYAWSAAQEKGGQDYAIPSGADPTFVAPPTNLVVTNDPLTTADGTVVPRLRVSFTAAAEGQLAGYELQYKLSTDLFYVSGFPLAKGLIVTYIAYLDAGVAYDVRIRSVNLRGGHSEWVEELSTVASGDTTAPAAPVLGSLSSGASDEITATWTAPADADTTKLRFYRASSAGAASPTEMSGSPVFVLPGSAGSFTESGIAPGTWYVRARAADASGNLSPYSNELNITL